MNSNLDGQLKYINHACYFIESRNSILICDPWLEGLAFNNGWSLLDNSTSNKKTIKELIKKNKKIFIWYSHEHSDHFSISFLKEIKKSVISLSVIYQKTLDRRVIKFLKSQNIQIIEADNGVKIFIDDQLSFFIWSHKNGDSFSLLLYKKIKILNLNDCIVSNRREAINISKKIRPITSEIDFLFTQFGYANWIGNENDKNIRIRASIEKQERILLQNSFLYPKIIIPFASYISFCDYDNFYLNFEQNTPRKLKNSILIKPIKDKIFFFKPQDSFSLDNYKNEIEKLKSLSDNAIQHWEKLFDKITPIKQNYQIIDIHILIKDSEKYIRLINRSFLFLPAFLEFIKLIKPVNIYVKDIDINFYFSYLNGLNIFKGDSWDIKISSQNLYYSIRNEYGFNTLKVNGKFESREMNSYLNFVYFFYFQDLNKESINFKNPIKLLKKIFESSFIFVKNILSFKI